MPRVAVQKMDYALSLRSATVDCGTDCIGTGNITAMGWIKTYSLGSSSAGRILTNGVFYIYVFTNNIIRVTSNGGGTVAVSNNSAIEIKKWQHVAVTRSLSGVVNIYVNGILSGSPNQSSGSPGAAITNLYMGNQQSPSVAFDGLFKNWVIVPRVCTQAEIQSHMNGTTPTNAVRVYKQNEGTGSTMIDSSPNAVNGTITNGTWTTDTPSKARTASSGRRSVQDMHCSYDYTSPTTSYISKTGLSNTAALASSLACGGWFKLSSAANGGWPVFFYIFGQLQLMYSESAKRLSINGNINGMFYNTNFTGNQFNFHTGGWVHLCITYDNTTIRGYINGELVYTLVAGGPINISTTTFAAGGTGSNSFTGKMKQIFLSTFMTSAQIAEIYKSGQISSTPYILWALDEGAGNIAYDSSGNGNNGTITSGTWSADVPSKKRGVVGGNMVPNGDFSFVPVVNVPQTANGNRWLDGTAGGSISNYLFGWSYSTNVSGSSSVMFDRNVKSPSGGNSIKVSTLAINSVGQVTTSAVDPITGAAVLSKPAFAVKPNTSYTYSYLMRTELVSGASNNGANILWKERNAAGSNTVINGNEIIVTTSSEWTLYAGSFTTAASTVNITPQPSVIGNTGAATLIMDAWFADIQLRPTIPTTRGVS